MNKRHLFTPIIAVVIGFFAVVACGATNDLWFQRVASTNLALNGMSAAQVCIAIEKESKRIDPTGRGVRIVYSLTPFPNSTEPTLVSGPSTDNGITLIELLGCLRALDFRYIVTDDVAIVTRWNFRYVLVVLHGKCIDAETRKPITDFKIEGGLLDPVLAISPDGSYVCGIPDRIDFYVNDDGIVSAPKLFEAVQELSVSAPGYKKRQYTKPVFENGKTGYRKLDIELHSVNVPDETNVPPPELSKLSKMDSKQVAILKKLDRIKIPEIDFRQANINDVVAFLQAASVKFDESEDEKKGVSIILDLGLVPATVPPSSTPTEVPLITFTAKHISLVEALNIVTQVANLTYRIDDNAVIISRRK